MSGTGSKGAAGSAAGASAAAAAAGGGGAASAGGAADAARGGAGAAGAAAAARSKQHPQVAPSGGPGAHPGAAIAAGSAGSRAQGNSGAWPTDVVVVGATSAIAEQCTRLWLEGGASTALLIGRDEAKLARIATDLGVRFPSAAVTTLVADLVSPESISSTVAGFAGPGSRGASAGAGLTVLVAHGSMTEQEESQASLSTAASVLEVTGVSPSLWIEACADTMTSGTIAVLGSPAGDRGRRKNYIYGAAKALIEAMSEGLQHRLAGTPLRVVLVKPGPTATPMTAHLPQNGLAAVEAVAGEIVAGVNAGRPVVYAPLKWKLIMAIVRNIPAPVFNRLNF